MREYDANKFTKESDWDWEASAKHNANATEKLVLIQSSQWKKLDLHEQFPKESQIW